MPISHLVFNKTILPISHTFVATQSLNVPGFTPSFLGFRHDASAQNLIENCDTLLLEQFTKSPKFSSFLLDAGMPPPKTLLQALKEKDPSHIHAHFGRGGFYCSAISKKLNTPLITTFHGSDITKADKRTFNKKHRALVFKSSERVIAISKFIERKLIESGCAEEKIIQHYTGVDCDFFNGNAEKSEAPTILFVGRLIEQKGCRYLLESFKSVQKTIPEARLLIAGYGKEMGNLSALSKELSNIDFLGPQTPAQIRNLLGKAWVTCLPSIKMPKGSEEGLSMVCLESQAMNTPVVGFDTGGVGEAVVRENTGLLVQEKDTAALSDALVIVLKDTRLRKQLAANGLYRVRRDFNLKKQGEKLAQIYLSII